MNRSTDLVARYGGEEFVVVLPETNSEGGFHVVEKISRNIKGAAITHQSSKVSNFVTISCGVATRKSFSWELKSESEADDLIREADLALYEAKSQGRDRVCVSARS